MRFRKFNFAACEVAQKQSREGSHHCRARSSFAAAARRRIATASDLLSLTWFSGVGSGSPSGQRRKDHNHRPFMHHARKQGDAEIAVAKWQEEGKEEVGKGRQWIPVSLGGQRRHLRPKRQPASGRRDTPSRRIRSPRLHKTVPLFPPQFSHNAARSLCRFPASPTRRPMQALDEGEGAERGHEVPRHHEDHPQRKNAGMGRPMGIRRGPQSRIFLS
eukprot:gene13149-biopygen2671